MPRKFKKNRNVSSHVEKKVRFKTTQTAFNPTGIASTGAGGIFASGATSVGIFPSTISGRLLDYLSFHDEYRVDSCIVEYIPHISTTAFVNNTTTATAQFTNLGRFAIGYTEDSTAPTAPATVRAVLEMSSSICVRPDDYFTWKIPIPKTWRYGSREGESTTAVNRTVGMGFFTGYYDGNALQAAFGTAIGFGSLIFNFSVSFRGIINVQTVNIDGKKYDFHQIVEKAFNERDLGQGEEKEEEYIIPPNTRSIEKIIEPWPALKPLSAQAKLFIPSQKSSVLK